MAFVATGSRSPLSALGQNVVTGYFGKSGDEIAKSLPDKMFGKDSKFFRAERLKRDEMIFDLIKKGNFILRWVPITVKSGKYSATFHVTAEPLMLGNTWDDGWYPGVNAITMQKIADHLNATLLTPKLVDEIFKQSAFQVNPHVGMKADVTMMDTSVMLEHSRRVKDRIRKIREQSKGKKYPPLIANIGKYWVVSGATSRRKKSGEDPNAVAAMNYGWHGKSGVAPSSPVSNIPGVKIWQDPGTRHPMEHVDYSQLVMLVSRSVQICEPTAISGFGSVYTCDNDQPCDAPGGPGKTRCMDIYDVAKDPDLAKLLSHEGVISMRMPDVSYEQPEVCAIQITKGIAGFGATEPFRCGGDPGEPPKNIGEGAPFDTKKAALVGAGVFGGAYIIYRLAAR